MVDLAKRFDQNPILRPQDVQPSLNGLTVECLLNPGTFRFQGKTWLLLRVAERPQQNASVISTIVVDPSTQSGLKVLEFKKGDPLLSSDDDPRKFVYDGKLYLTTLSHLRLASSEDGITFQVTEFPTLVGQGPLETFGIEDCRVAEIEDRFYLTYTAVSSNGFGVGLRSTTNWRDFTHHNMIFSPPNKDCALFPEKIGDGYFALHRPTGTSLGNSIWISRSPDLLHWGEHDCIVKIRPGMWDSARVGAGSSPIRTLEGWLEIYHGADEQNRYCLGALLLDLKEPTKVLARSHYPIMEPLMKYEKEGFFNDVVFTNGMVVDGDEITIYYGAADLVICGATLSVEEVLRSLK